MTDVDVVRAMLEAWGAGAPRRELMDPDVEWIMPHPDLSASSRGEVGSAMDEFRNTWDEYEFHVEDVRPLEDGRVLALFTERVKGATSGIEQVAHPGAICTVENGKLVRFEAFVRRDDAFRAAGLPEEPQSHS